MFNRLAIALLCCGLVVASSFAATTAIQRKTANLKQLNKQITSLSSTLAQEQHKREALVGQLKTTEVNIGQLAIEIRSLNKNISKQHKSIKELNHKMQSQEVKLDKQRVDMAKQLRLAYKMGDDEYLKLILNQQDPNRISRALTYMRYFNEARLKLMRKLDAMVASLQKTRDALQQTNQAMQVLLDQKTHTREKMRWLKSHREQVLLKLTEKIQTKSQRLLELKSNKSRLQKVLSALRQHLTDINLPQPKLPFVGMRGRLPWPVIGHLVNLFGRRIEGSQLRHHGVLIEAPAGRPVHAIYPGRVVFSDWLSGFGLLMIIKHGKNYMTLYGHDQSLYKKVGDWVNAGDLIATVGNSGGYSQPGLYFEIRYKGKPINPRAWFGKMRRRS